MKLRALVAAALTLVALLLAGGPASAHGSGGLIEVEAAHPTGTGFHYIVRLTYRSDGHPVADAAVTATPVGPDGGELDPVELTPYDDDGRYQAAVDMPEPGSWTVRFATDDPEATAETTAEVSATTTTGSAETTEGGGFAPADDETGGSAATDSSDGDSGDDGFPVLVVVAAAVVAVGGLFTTLRVIRRNRPVGGTGPDSPTGGGPDDPGGPAAES